VLAIYTNAILVNLGLVAEDEDRGGFYTSQVLFNAVAGLEYQIAVDGFSAASGPLVLSWNLDTSTVPFPRILVEPSSQTVRAGDTASFAVVVSSLTPRVTSGISGACRARSH